MKTVALPSARTEKGGGGAGLESLKKKKPDQTVPVPHRAESAKDVKGKLTEARGLKGLEKQFPCLSNSGTLGKSFMGATARRPTRREGVTIRGSPNIAAEKTSAY